jgi:hypothetical protein
MGYTGFAGFEALSEKADLQGVSSWCASRCASRQVDAHERGSGLRPLNLLSGSRGSRAAVAGGAERIGRARVDAQARGARGDAHAGDRTAARSDRGRGIEAEPDRRFN